MAALPPADGKQPEHYLLELLAELARVRYEFIPPTPETHRRVVARRASSVAGDLRDVLGWSLGFSRDSVPDRLFDLLSHAQVLTKRDGEYRSSVRVASVDGRLFLHSAYPTDKPDSVFLGPDTYRFVRMVRTELAEGPPVRRLVDIGAGAGVGAIVAHEYCPGAQLALIDTNPLALRFASINARHAGASVELIQGSGLDDLRGNFDLAIANPPFIADPAGPAYRDGRGAIGSELLLTWAGAAMRRVVPGGRVLLYTGSPVIAGRDSIKEALHTMAADQRCSLRYEELDPDIFGEELDKSAYRNVERIAAVMAVVSKPGDPPPANGR